MEVSSSKRGRRRRLMALGTWPWKSSYLLDHLPKVLLPAAVAGRLVGLQRLFSALGF